MAPAITESFVDISSPSLTKSPNPPAPMYAAMAAMAIPMTTAVLTPAIIMGADRGSYSWIRSWKYVIPMPLPASMVAGSTFFNAI